MIKVQTNKMRVRSEELRDGDWVIADFGDQLTLARYQDSLVQGNFRPVLLDESLLEQLGFTPVSEDPKSSEVKVYQFGDGQVSVVNQHAFTFEGGERGRIDVGSLHQLQQTWRQTFDHELVTDFLEQPHEIIID